MPVPPEADDFGRRFEIAEGTANCHPEKLGGRPVRLKRFYSDSATNPFPTKIPRWQDSIPGCLTRHNPCKSGSSKYFDRCTSQTHDLPNRGGRVLLLLEEMPDLPRRSS